MEVVYVFLVFHKKGKYKVKEFDGEDELEDFLIKYLNKHKKYCNIDLKNSSLYELVNEGIKVGSIVLDEKVGYGIVKVVSGTEFEDSCSYSDDSEFIESVNSESDSGSESISEGESDEENGVEEEVEEIKNEEVEEEESKSESEEEDSE